MDNHHHQSRSISFITIIGFVIGITIMTMTEGLAQTKPCVFCRIAKGEMQSSQVVYRDPSIVAFMDYAPTNPGHVLVVPLVHASLLTDMPDSTARNMLSVARKIAIAIQKTDIQAEGFNLRLNSGQVAGQEVAHCHMHVVPRYAAEKLNTTKEKMPADQLDQYAQKIRTALTQ